MNAVSGENLTDVFLSMKSMPVQPRHIDGALGRVTNEARFFRTTATCVWGVSDPHELKHGAVSRGWQRGSLTPQVLPELSVTAALTATRAAQSAARCAVAKPLDSKDID